MADLTTTNVLLGILAGVAVLQMMGLIVGGVMAWRAYRHGVERVEAIERQVEEMLAPLAARAGTIMDRVDRVSARVDHGTETLDHALAVTGQGAQIAMSVVNGNVQRTAAFAAALASGGRAALRAWRARGAAARDRRLTHGSSPLALASARADTPSSPYVNHHRTEDSHVSI